MSEIIRSIEAKQLRTDIPAIAVGDTVKVMVRLWKARRSVFRLLRAL